MANIKTKLSAFMIALSLPASGVFAAVTFSIDSVWYNLGMSLPASPYASATISEIEGYSDRVMFSFDATNLLGDERSLGQWDFSYTGSVDGLTFTPSSGGVLNDAYYWGAGGGNNVSFYFNNGNFSAIPNVIVSTNDSSSLTPGDFLGIFGPGTQSTLSTFQYGIMAVLYSAMEAPPVAAPEPMTYLSLASLLTIVGIVGRRRLAYKRS